MQCPAASPAPTPSPPSVDPLPQDPRQTLLAVLGVCAVVCLVALDSTIVGTILPRVARELGGMSLYAWVGTGYLLSSAVFIPIFGRLGDLFGRKTFILVSIVIVALGSALSGLAQSMPQLIAARTLQGVGGGMMIATAFAAPADLFPDPLQRVRWQALISTAFAVASGLGPMLGGAVTDWLGWRAAFFVTPLMAIGAFVLLYRHFPALRPKHARRPRIDWIGGFLLALAVGAPMIALELGFAAEARPMLGLGFFVAGVAAVALLVVVEQRVELPMFPLRVLATAEARLLSFVGLLTGAVMFVLMYYGPLLLQVEVGLSTAQSGMVLAPLVACIPVGSVINGRLFPTQSQPQRLMVLGALVLAAGCIGVMTLREGSPMAWCIATFSVSGIGLGFLLPNLTLFIQMIADRRDVGVASALIQTTRALGSALGTALVGLVIARTSVHVGVQAGMVASLAACVAIMMLANRVRMKNC